MLQSRVCSSFMLKSKAVQIVVMQFGLLWLKVHEF
jgi:hypothetical protein